MALFTDGGVSSIEDLRGYDTQLLDVAHTEGIDVTRKLLLAEAEIAAEVNALMARAARSGAPLDCGKVVVTPPLKLWHTFLALELVYRDAFRNQLNERYAGKRDEFHEMVKWAYEKTVQAGLGIASDPVSRANAPVLEPCAGSLPDGSYYVAIAWTNAAGAEGACSTASTIDVAGGSFAVRPASYPKNAAGWNVYAGTTIHTLTLQNSAQLGIGETWTQPDNVAGGKLAGNGQSPDYLLPTPRTIQRG